MKDAEILGGVVVLVVISIAFLTLSLGSEDRIICNYSTSQYNISLAEITRIHVDAPANISYTLSLGAAGNATVLVNGYPAPLGAVRLRGPADITVIGAQGNASLRAAAALCRGYRATVVDPFRLALAVLVAALAATVSFVDYKLRFKLINTT